MNINSIINQINNVFSTNQSVPAGQEALNDSLQNGMKLLMDMGNNSVITGKVVSMDGEKILLNLGENALLEATMDQNLNPEIGQSMSFMVKGAQTGKVTLSALFENLNQQSTVNGALKAAGIPSTPENQYMVKTMMEEGLPIDKESLYSMSRAVKMNSTADVLDLAKMTRLNIPLNEEMISAFKNYENVEHQIINTLADVSDSLTDSFTKMINEGSSPKEALEFLVNIQDILSQDTDGIEGEGNGLSKDIVNDNQEALKTTNESSNRETINNTNGDTTNLSGKAITGENGTTVKEEFINVAGKALDNATDNKVVTSNNLIGTEDIKSNVSNSGIANNNQSISLAENTEAVSASENKTNMLSQEDVKNFFDRLKETLKTPMSDEEIKKLAEAVKDTVSKSVFKDSFKQMLTDKFLLKPEEIGEEGKVLKLYERLESEIKSVNNFLEQSQKQNTPIANTINSINQNLDFMNQLNQTFNYVQIPLKMANQQSTGELYVYSNKKSLANNDGNVSALLHLDMDNLGTVDVHVMLNSNNNVKTKFMLKDDEALDLIANNIDILNERLNNRGYSMTSEFVNNKEPKSVLETILDDNKNISMISTASFDARA